MLPLTLRLLVAVTCFTAVFIRGKAADTCPTTTTSCIPGLPGRDGKDGQPGCDGVASQPGHDGRDGVAGPAGRDGAPGRDGRDCLPGPTGSLANCTDPQEIKEIILSMIREEVSKMNCCSSGQNNTAPEPSCNISTQDNTSFTSCKEIYECNSMAPSGYYMVSTDSGPQQVYCEMNATRCGNITSG